MWSDKLKEANVSVHAICTGAGAGFQDKLWNVVGSSAYLSGATFPYSQEEQEELLGFMPEHFCSEEAAVDLASTAYMKAYRFGGKGPVGIGLTASVASAKEHRGDHQAFVVVMTDDKVIGYHHVFKKGIGEEKRYRDGKLCNSAAFVILNDALGLDEIFYDTYKDLSQVAHDRFFARPYFASNGKRYATLDSKHRALMPGNYNPPHEGHFGMADAYENTCGGRVVFSITTNPPHKEAMTVQDCLKRAKLLGGRDKLFTMDDPYYIDKARKYPNTPILIGADALIRMFDPKWGLDLAATFEEFKQLRTKFYVSGRMIDGKFVNGWAPVASLPLNLYNQGNELFVEMNGQWDISSTELRDKVSK